MEEKSFFEKNLLNFPGSIIKILCKNPLKTRKIRGNFLVLQDCVIASTFGI